jgi:hypothetical protein
MLARETYGVTYRVVIGDGVRGLVFLIALGVAGVVAATVLQDRRLEDGLLGVRMGIEAGAEEIPDCRELFVGRCVVEREELAAQPIVVGADELDDVGHARQPYQLTCG